MRSFKISVNIGLNWLVKVVSFNNMKILPLTLSWRKSLSYRNQSTDFYSKSIDWILYDRDLRHGRVKKMSSVSMNKSTNNSRFDHIFQRNSETKNSFPCLCTIHILTSQAYVLLRIQSLQSSSHKILFEAERWTEMSSTSLTFYNCKFFYLLISLRDIRCVL